MSRRAYIFVMSLVVISFCPQGLAEPQTLPKPGASWERIRQPGGTLIAPAQHLNSEEKLKFYSGLSFFKQPWIRAPASTTARDGLGPIFNANSCISCHVNGGRSRSLIHDPNTSTAVVRISVVGPDGQVLPHPLFGSQVQTKSTFGLPEAQISVVTHTTSKQVAGREYVLRKPSVSLSFNTGGETKPVAVLSSLRQAPSLIGMGLLEAIEQERLQGLEDPKDSDADGISGRIHWVNDPVLGRAPGRFGWKSLHSTVAAQSGSAFRDDMGITNRYFPESPCEQTQRECLRQIDGADPEEGVEIVDLLFDYVVHLTAHIPPPKAGELTPTVRRGRTLFNDVGCAGCHTPNHQTRYGEIWPYTDLLLHDMGEGLADHRPEGEANGREWRTAPLWGLGTQKTVSGHTELLHDGRAKNLVEAVLWHGGEAAPVRERFLQLSKEDIDALRAFVRAI